MLNQDQSSFILSGEIQKKALGEYLNVCLNSIIRKFSQRDQLCIAFWWQKLQWTIEQLAKNQYKQNNSLSLLSAQKQICCRRGIRIYSCICFLFCFVMFLGQVADLTLSGLSYSKLMPNVSSLSLQTPNCLLLVIWSR